MVERLWRLAKPQTCDVVTRRGALHMYLLCLVSGTYDNLRTTNEEHIYASGRREDGGCST